MRGQVSAAAAGLLLAAGLPLGGCGGGSADLPGTPTGVVANAGSTVGSVIVSFTPPVSNGSNPISGYTVVSSPTGITASGTGSPISLECPAASCKGYSFSVFATNAAGNSTASAPVHVVNAYSVTATFLEPTAPTSSTVFTGAFSIDFTEAAVLNLAGTLSEALVGPPPGTLYLGNELATASDGNGGLLVSAFALDTTNVFAGGGFRASAGSQTYGNLNAYVTIDVNLALPLQLLPSTQLDMLSYGDCTANGLVGSLCMTGLKGGGSHGGYPVFQVIQQQ